MGVPSTPIFERVLAKNSHNDIKITPQQAKIKNLFIHIAHIHQEILELYSHNSTRNANT